MPTSIAVLDVRTPGAPPPPPATPGPRIALDLTLKAAREIFVRGRGLDAELGGTVRVHGTTAKPQPDGSFEMLRGEFRLAGQTLTFSKGVVSFNGGSLTDPSLNFVASATSGNVTATLTVSGTAEKPKITLSSVPDLPQDEVLAHLLFGRGTSSLGALELAQIAAAAASLTGVTSGVGDPLESIRKSLGLSRLSVSGGSGGPTLEAGRYVTPGVYVGAKQGMSGSGTQTTVQIDLAKGLKLESTVGTGSSSGTTSGAANSGGSSVGLIYQFEY
jgi:translocation and assembly module TamB